jgi:D-alanine-D-alanine ligase
VRIAVVYNPNAKGIINVFGIQNREWYPQETIDKIVSALKKNGHEVELIAGDRHLLTRLNKFLPRLSRRRPNGLVLNMALGIQGKCRYTHVPAILEVAGIPYTGSSPLGHTLAMDKVVAKQIFAASGLLTPNHQVITDPEERVTRLQYPLIVKPRGEAASFGLRIVHDRDSLEKAIDEILINYRQPALVEEFIEGREINVGVIGNHEPEALPVLELLLGEEEGGIYTYEKKFAKSARKSAKKVCPAELPAETAAYIQKIAVEAFLLLNVNDIARVDFRLNRYNQPYVLEVNSMPSLNPRSSFVYAAKKAGYSYDRLINRIVEAAYERYAAEEPDYFNQETNGPPKKHPVRGEGASPGPPSDEKGVHGEGKRGPTRKIE